MSEILPFQADATEAPSKDNARKLRPGIVLDKDGKPCKTCTAFRDLISLPTKRPTPSLQSKQQQTTPLLQQPAHCPPDVEVLGRSTWTFLHTMAANYPEKPSAQQQREVSSFISTLGRFYPCWHCADDFRSWMAKGNEPKVHSRREFENWMCNAHNEVNRKLGKDAFDCGEESLNIRWRDGPKDGSCG
jgi:mitochondrial FAD-linked sulfhydryl oxidase